MTVTSANPFASQLAASQATASQAAVGQAAAATAGAGAGANALSPAQLAKMQDSARSFESMFLGEMLKPMFDTVDTSKGLFGGGAGEATWKPMLVDEMAKQMARNGGIGLADSVLREMIKVQGAGG